MENKRKFKPFDKVLARDLYVDGGAWIADLYSHYSDEFHYCLGVSEVSDLDILPYEGNEYLLGTTNEPDKEVKLKKGELGFATNLISDDAMEWDFISFSHISGLCNILNRDCKSYLYFVPFFNFYPNNMEETRKHILCVKNGKIIRYHNK